jgi:hypothetical protein
MGKTLTLRNRALVNSTEKQRSGGKVTKLAEQVAIVVSEPSRQG